MASPGRQHAFDTGTKLLRLAFRPRGIFRDSPSLLLCDMFCHDHLRFRRKLPVFHESRVLGSWKCLQLMHEWTFERSE